MRPVALIAAASLSLTLVLGAFSAPRRATVAAPDAARMSEVARIRAHFDSVIGELQARDVGGLAVGQRERRVALIETLRGYRDRGATSSIASSVSTTTSGSRSSLMTLSSFDGSTRQA